MASSTSLSTWEIDDKMKKVLQDNRITFLEQLETAVVVQAYPDFHQSVRDQIMQKLINKGNFSANIDLLDAIQRTEDFSNNLLRVLERNNVSLGLAKLIRRNLPVQELQQNILSGDAEPARQNTNSSENCIGFVGTPRSSVTSLDGNSEKQQETEMQERVLVLDDRSNHTASSEQPNMSDTSTSENNHEGLVFKSMEKTKKKPDNISSENDSNAPSMLTTNFNLNKDESKEKYQDKFLPHLPPQEPNIVSGKNTREDDQFDSCDDASDSDTSFYLDSKEMGDLIPSSWSEATNDFELPNTEIEDLKHAHNTAPKTLLAGVNDRTRSDSDVSFKSCHSDESSQTNLKKEFHVKQLRVTERISSQTEVKTVYEYEHKSTDQGKVSLSHQEDLKEVDTSSDTEVKQVYKEEENANRDILDKKNNMQSLQDENGIHTTNVPIEDFAQAYVNQIIESAQTEVKTLLKFSSGETIEKDCRPDSVNRLNNHNEEDHSDQVKVDEMHPTFSSEEREQPTSLDYGCTSVEPVSSIQSPTSLDYGCTSVEPVSSIQSPTTNDESFGPVSTIESQSQEIENSPPPSYSYIAIGQRLLDYLHISIPELF